MIKLVIFIFICWGLTNILSKGKIFEPLRDFFDLTPGFSFFSQLIHCPMCVGFWVGLFASHFLYSPTRCFLNNDFAYSSLTDGFMISGISWVIYCFLEHCKCYEL